MNEEKMGEETYSLIFASLRHPIRRRILRMLADHPSTFSEILDSLSIDSGHLSYHLENLGELIKRPQDGKYELSSIGAASVKLMSGVEEHQTSTSNKESKMRLTIVNVFLLMLVGALIGGSFFLANLTLSLRSESLDTSPGTLILVRPGQVFRFNVTTVYTTGMERRVIANDSLYYERPPPISTITLWEEGYFWFGLTSNETYIISVTVHSPNGSNVTSREDNMAPGSPLGSLGLTPLAQAGEYVLEIKNIGSQDMRGLLTVHELWQFSERPWFYYGVAGLLVALPYPAWVLFRLVKAKSYY